MMELMGGFIDARTGEFMTMCPEVRDEMRNVMDEMSEVTSAMAEHVRVCPNMQHKIELGREWATASFASSVIASSIGLPDGTLLCQDNMKLPQMVAEMLLMVPPQYQPDGWYDLIAAATEQVDVTTDDVDEFLRLLFEEDEQPETD